jgi:hypothetical protein
MQYLQLNPYLWDATSIQNQNTPCHVERQDQCTRLLFSRTLHYVVCYKFTDILEEHIIHIIRSEGKLNRQEAFRVNVCLLLIKNVILLRQWLTKKGSTSRVIFFKTRKLYLFTSWS